MISSSCRSPFCVTERRIVSGIDSSPPLLKEFSESNVDNLFSDVVNGHEISERGIVLSEVRPSSQVLGGNSAALITYTRDLCTCLQAARHGITDVRGGRVVVSSEAAPTVPA
jgi:hypothetical protein